MREQLDLERRLIGGASFLDLQKEMWLIPGNRKRALISIMLMVCQQMTGTNAINYYAPQIFADLGISGENTGLFATGIYGCVKVVCVPVEYVQDGFYLLTIPYRSLAPLFSSSPRTL